jgi:hypothetical protein
MLDGSLYFTGNQRFSGFAIFNIKKNRLIWFGLGLFNIFKKQNPPISGQA